MTQKEQKSALAEWAGWRGISPDYINDLNAMADLDSKMEVGFDGSQADDYQHALWEVANPGRGGMNEHTIMDVAYLQAFICATAAQRCEALCRVLWPDRFL